jgi:hypothetical protein
MSEKMIVDEFFIFNSNITTLKYSIKKFKKEGKRKATAYPVAFHEKSLETPKSGDYKT